MMKFYKAFNKSHSKYPNYRRLLNDKFENNKELMASAENSESKFQTLKCGNPNRPAVYA
jgi:ribosomal protein S17E